MNKPQLFCQKGVLSLLMVLVLSLSLVFIISEQPNMKDARQNFIMSYNLYKHGMISLDLDRSTSLEPTNKREPLPIFVTSLFMNLHPGINKDMSFEQMDEGPVSARIKQVNIVWSLLCLLGVFWLTLMLTSSHSAGMLTVFGTWFFYITHTSYVDRLLTEIPASALLLGLSISLVHAFKKRSYPWLGVSGLLTGCLALTKAVFLYVGIGGILAVFLILVFSRDFSPRKTILGTILLILGFTVMVTPWMLRNSLYLDEFKIAQRGGAVLLTRAYKNQVSLEEYIGAFYIWSPNAGKKIIGPVLGFSKEDLMLGGRLQRLNSRSSDFDEIDIMAARNADPDAAISFRRKQGAERNKLSRELEEQGVSNPGSVADSMLQKKAIRMILDAPLKHLAMTIPFAWYGMWAFPVTIWKDALGVLYVIPAGILNLLGYACMMFMPVLALKRRKPELLLIFLFPIGMVLFYALFTHGLPRYNLPAVPFMLIALAATCLMFYKRNHDEHQHGQGKA